MGKILVNLTDVDITQTYLFDEYVQYKDQLNLEVNNIPFLQTYIPPKEKEQRDEINKSISSIPHDKLKAKADALIESQKLKGKHDDLLEHMISKSKGSYNHYNSMWSPLLWQANENSDRTKVSIGDKVYEIYDLDYYLAESLQHLYSSEDPVAEYYDWIDRQQKIEFNINTAGTTEEEIVARYTFIEFLNDRETDMKRIMNLYASAAFNPNSRMQETAQEKLKFLSFKISELRRLRQKTENTKDHADTKEQLAKEEEKRQKEATAAVAGLAAIALADAKFSLLNKHIETPDSSIYEDGAGQSIVDLQPETTNQAQAQQKIARAQERHRHLQELIRALQNGQSKEEWEKAKELTRIKTVIQNNISRLAGFSKERFISMA